VSQSRSRSCRGKRRYETREQAVQYATWRMRTTGATRKDTDVYKCRYCGGFHVGHRPRKRRAN